MSKKEWLIAGLLVALFLFTRLFRFGETFHFYYDQPLFSIKALEIWRSGDVPLIGPPISFSWEGRQIFQGGIIYFTQLLFLLIGGFDPMKSTLSFILVAALMIIPLWVGVRKIGGVEAAILACVFYSLFPPMITGTLELTNPYFQLALTPLLIWVIANYTQKPNWNWALALGLSMGILLQFHYQFVLVILLVFAYLIVKETQNFFKNISLIGVGCLIGFSPLIIFELRNNFYNIQTLGLYISHWNEFSQQFGGDIPLQYFLSLMLMTFSLTVIHVKLSNIMKVLLVGILSFVAIRDFVIYPTQGGILKEWKYNDELVVNQLIKSQDLTDYNIVMWYDTRSITQRYLLMRENRDFDFEDYRTNRYLFIVYPNDKWQNDGAYELNTFNPAVTRKIWMINNNYSLYLAERVQ